MNFVRLVRVSVLLTLGVFLVASVSLAQDQSQQPQDQGQGQDTDNPNANKPKPAARGIPGMSDPNATVEDQQQPTNWQPDNGPATGLQAPTVGRPELGHSYWVPGFIFGSTIESRPPGLLGPNTNGWYANNYVGGEVSLLEEGGRSVFGLNATGGGYFTTDSLESNGGFGNLSAAYDVNLDRWNFQVFDYFSYIPESQFGFAGGSGLAVPGVSGTLGPSIPGLAAAVVPNQSIYSAIGPRYSNAFAAQATYQVSRRASITVGGSYGILNFTQPGNINNDMALGNVGFNYAINPHDSIGVLYRFTGFHYDGEPQALGTHVVNAVYQKKVAARLALSFFGGPEFTEFRVPVGNKTSTTGVSAGASLTYQFQTASIGLNYFHGVTAGSGILLGSTTDQATVTLTKQFARVWSGMVNVGYSHNASLTTGPGLISPSFDNWFAGGTLSRPIGRNMQVSGTYEASYESTSPSSPGVPSSYMQNVIVITFEFHTRPFVLP
jgi:hypothetical protein